MSREQLIVALSRTNRVARRQQIDLREVASETVIIPARHATPGYFEHARSVFQAAGVMPERIYHTSLLQPGALLVGAGLGISLVPASFQRVKVEGMVYRPLAMGSPTIALPMIDLIAARRRDNTSPLLARIAREIKERSATFTTTV